MARLGNTLVLVISWALLGIGAVAAAILTDEFIANMTATVPLLLIGFVRGVLIIGGSGTAIAAIAVAAHDAGRWFRGSPTRLVVSRHSLATLLKDLAVIGTACASAGALLAPVVISDLRRQHPTLPAGADQYLVVWLGALGVAYALVRWSVRYRSSMD